LNRVRRSRLGGDVHVGVWTTRTHLAAPANQLIHDVASARVTASRLLTKANIAPEVKAALEDRRRRTETTADNIIKELTRIAFFDIGVLFTNVAG
jgi:hypothetical protein